MARSVADIPEAALARFRKGTAIPAHPLALTAARALDETRQRALSRYYIDAGAGGLAVGVHTTGPPPRSSFQGTSSMSISMIRTFGTVAQRCSACIVARCE